MPPPTHPHTQLRGGREASKITLTQRSQQRMLLLAYAATAQVAPDIAPPTAISITSEIDGEAFFNITMGECMCEKPKCATAEGVRTLLQKGQTLTYEVADNRCSYYKVGGTISSIADGTVCYTWQADYSQCKVYPSHAFTSSFVPAGADVCSRLVGASCKMRTSVDAAGMWKSYPTVITLTGTVDASCDTMPWAACTGSSTCCGGTAGFACRHQKPDTYGNMDRICQPAHGSHATNEGPADDPQIVQAWQAKGVHFNS